MYLTRSRFDDIKDRIARCDVITPDEQFLYNKQLDYDKINFGFFNSVLTKKQCEIVEYFKNYNEVIVRGGVRSGKTLADCFIICCRISGYYPVAYEEHENIWGYKVYKPIFKKMVLPGTRERCKVWVSCLNRPTQVASGGMQETLMDLIPKPWVKDTQTLCGKYIIKVLLTNGSTIEFKSADVGRRGYQSATIDLLIADEAHPESVIEEATSRSGTYPLKFVYSYFPEPEPSTVWAHDKYIVPELDGKTPPYRKVTRASYLDNVMIPEDQRQDQIQRWKDADIYDQRVNGDFVDLGGRVYKTFSRSRHVMNIMDIPGFRENGGEPPADWIKFMGVDTHNSQKGCAALMCALDPKTGRRVYFNEYQDSNDPYSWCDYFNETNDKYNFTAAYIDPSAYSVDASGFCIGEKLEEMTTIPFEKANRAHSQGRCAVMMGLAKLRYPDGKDVDGLPGIIICSHCTMTIRQMENYSFKSDATTEVIKSDDEYCDCLRYIEVTTPQEWYGPRRSLQSETNDFGNPNLSVV